MAGAATEGRGHRFCGDPAFGAQDDLCCCSANCSPRRGTSSPAHLVQLAGEVFTTHKLCAQSWLRGAGRRGQCPLVSGRLSSAYLLGGVESTKQHPASGAPRHSRLRRDLNFLVLKPRSTDQNEGDRHPVRQIISEPMSGGMQSVNRVRRVRPEGPDRLDQICSAAGGGYLLKATEARDELLAGLTIGRSECIWPPLHRVTAVALCGSAEVID